jgi:LPS-assembly lipoprotein
MTRIHVPAVLLALLVLALPACGFHLRDALTLPPDMDQVRVVARDPYSALAQSLSRSLERAGLDVAERESPGAAVLRIHSEQWESQAISVDQFGRAQEYTLRYAAVFSLVDGNGEVLVPQQVIELSRDYVSLPENSTGSESERELLSRELQREMASSVLRRIDSVTRSRAAESELQDDNLELDAPAEAPVVDAPAAGTP